MAFSIFVEQILLTWVRRDRTSMFMGALMHLSKLQRVQFSHGGHRMQKSTCAIDPWGHMLGQHVMQNSATMDVGKPHQQLSTSFSTTVRRKTSQGITTTARR